MSFFSLSLFFFIIGALQSAPEPHLQVHISTHKNVSPRAKTKIALIATSKDEKLTKVVQLLAKNLEHSGQCTVEILHGASPKKKSDIDAYYKQEYQFIVFLEMLDPLTIVGRLYDGLDTTMMQGKKWGQRASLTEWAQKITEDIWLQLMGNKGSFTSKIAYTKKSHTKTETPLLQLGLIDWDGSEKIVLSSSQALVAPSWKADGSILFFSQFTPRNVRLVATDLKGNAWVVINQDGTNMGVSSAQGTDSVIYCHSGDIWKCSYENKKTMHTLIVRDGGMCASPTLLNNGDIMYCSGGKIKRWNVSTQKSTLLTDTGYCVGPSYHQPSRRLVYSKRMGKDMQLILYNDRTQEHRQLTFNPGDKIDPTWSPCGNYIAYCLSKGKNNTIMVINCITHAEEQVSPPGDCCSCPAWSPVALG